MLPYTDDYTYTIHKLRLEEANEHYAHPRPLQTRSLFLAHMRRGLEALRHLRQIRVQVTFEVANTPSVRPVNPEGC